MTVYAVKTLYPGSNENRSRIASLYEELKNGTARFGWSYKDHHDLTIQQSMLVDRQAYGKARWLLRVERGDYFVYVNMPSYGECTIVRISGDYRFTPPWTEGENDFRHMLPCEYLYTFSRNNDMVPPPLSRLLKLQGAHYEIKAKQEFLELLKNIETGISARSASERVDEMIKKALAEAARTIYSNYAGKPLEPLVAEILRSIPGITVKKGSDVGGDDLILTYYRGLPMLDFSSEVRCAVQVKAYMDDKGVIKAVGDLEKALTGNPDFSEGMIVTTATNISAEVEAMVDELAEKLEKPVYLMSGLQLVELAIQAGIFNTNTSVGLRISDG